MNPATLLFDADNWSSAQDLTVSIAAGASKSSSRDVNVNIAVHDAASSDPEYRNVPVETVAVAIDNPNRAPVFAPEQRTKTQQENVGTAETAVEGEVGTPVAATDPDRRQRCSGVQRQSGQFRCSG